VKNHVAATAAPTIDVAERTLTAATLQSPTQRAVRLVARGRLADLKDAYGRLHAGNANALHDLRVALRRLRTWIKAFRPYLDDTLQRKTRRSLERIAEITNGARDAEIGLSLLDTLDDLPVRTKRARGRLRTLFKEARAKAVHDIDDSLGGDFAALVNDLHDQLSFFVVRVSVDDGGEPEPMRVGMANVLRRFIDKLGRALKRVRSAQDVGEVHRARIAAKRVRYLIESLERTEVTTDVLTRLTAFQDSLGAFHDAKVVVGQLVDKSVEMAAKAERHRARAALGRDQKTQRKRTPLRPAELLDLAKRIEAHAAEVFARFEAVRDDRGLLDAARAVADGLGDGAPAQ
jgi:CHAD domain-containing protein